MKTILTSHFICLLLLIPGVGWAQVVTVSGYVNNGLTGKAMENVNIFESNSGIGTITNQNGFYKLTLNNKTIQLKIDSDGFKPYNELLTLKSDTLLIVNLPPVETSKKKAKKNDELQAGKKPGKKIRKRSGINQQ